MRNYCSVLVTAALAAGGSVSYSGHGPRRSHDTCADMARDDGAGVLVLDLGLRAKGDEGGGESALLVSHALATAGARVAFASFDPSPRSAKDAPLIKHARRLLHCTIHLKPRAVSAARRATAGYGEPAATRAAAARAYAEGLLDAVVASPFKTSLVVVAAPTRLAVCNASHLVASLALHHDAATTGTCERGLVATIGGRPRGRGQRFGIPLTLFVISGIALSWHRIYDEYAAAGVVSPQHALREALFRRAADLWRDLLPLAGTLGGAAAVGGPSSAECFACGGGANNTGRCHTTFCDRGCAVVFNCSDSREYRFQHSYGLSEVRSIAWNVLHGETCELRAALVGNLDEAAAAPNLLERAAKAKSSLFDRAEATGGSCLDIRQGPGQGRETEGGDSVGEITRRRNFVILSFVSPDEAAMLTEPWLNFAASKQAFAARRGYAFELVLSARVALGGCAEASAVVASSSHLRCEYLRPLIVLDALLRHPESDYALVTSHASFVAPSFWDASLDVFVEAAERQGRDLVLPSSPTLAPWAFFVRNSRAGRAALAEWWGIAVSGVVGGGCLPLEGAGLHLLILRRIDRYHRNQAEGARVASMRVADSILGSTASTAPLRPLGGLLAGHRHSTGLHGKPKPMVAALAETPLLVRPFGYDCRPPSCGHAGMVAASCDAAFRGALNVSQASSHAFLPFVAVVSRPPSPLGSPSALESGSALDLTREFAAQASVAASATASAARARAAARRTTDPAMLGWEGPAPLLWASPKPQTTAVGLSYKHGPSREASRETEPSFLVEAPFAPREVSRGLFPHLFGDAFAKAVGLPRGKPLALGGALRRTLLLHGKETWLASPWDHAGADSEAAEGGTRSVPKNAPRLMQLLNHVTLSPLDEWPPPRCCHPHRGRQRCTRAA